MYDWNFVNPAKSLFFFCFFLCSPPPLPPSEQTILTNSELMNSSIMLKNNVRYKHHYSSKKGMEIYFCKNSLSGYLLYIWPLIPLISLWIITFNSLHATEKPVNYEIRHFFFLFLLTLQCSLLSTALWFYSLWIVKCCLHNGSSLSAKDLYGLYLGLLQKTEYRKAVTYHC